MPSGRSWRRKNGARRAGRSKGKSMSRYWPVFLLAASLCAQPQSPPPLRDRAAKYLTDLLRLDTTNPPGNEARAARYLKQVADANGIPAELVGPDANRPNFIARLKGSGAHKPLLLIAHSDVVPADRAQWSVDPFAAAMKDGFIYG